MNVEILTPPETEPVTLAEAKVYLRIDADLTDDDTLIASLISTAREQIEVITSRALAPQTIRADFNCFPSGDIITLPRYPLKSVTSVVYNDADGNEQGFTDFDALIYAIPGAIRRTTSSWPSGDSVRVTYEAGSEAADIPGRARLAILYLTAHWFETRDVVVATSASDLPYGLRHIIPTLNVYYRRAA